MHQRDNNALALAMTQAWLPSQHPDLLPLLSRCESLTPEYLSNPALDGLANVRLPGRCQQVEVSSMPRVKWQVDGAHTVESLQASR